MKRITSFILGGLITSVFGVQAIAQKIDAVVIVSGVVLDETTRNPVGVSMKFIDETGTEKENSTRSNIGDGTYQAVLKPGKKYKVIFDNPNYFREERTIDIPNTSKYQNISRDWLVRPLRLNAKLPLPVSPFEYKKSKFRVGAEDFLSSLLSAMIKNPSVSIQINCYPDLADNTEANTKLTNERSAALKDYFVKGGVDASRINTSGNGDVDPLNPPPIRKGARGSRYVGSTYVVVTKI